MLNFLKYVTVTQLFVCYKKYKVSIECKEVEIKIIMYYACVCVCSWLNIGMVVHTAYIHNRRSPLVA